MSKESTFESVVSKLSTNQKKFIAELIGTFIVVVLATGSVVINAKLNGILGLPFIAFAPFVGVAIGVYLFGKISMAHFNPAVSVGFLITKHITRKLTRFVSISGDCWCFVSKSFCKYCNRQRGKLRS